MRLLYSATSPYARKVRAVLIERQLSGEVEMEEANPLGDAAALRAINPLGKVPVLILDDGQSLFDSPVICDHLDSLGTGPRLIPSDPKVRLGVLIRQALADGVMDAAFNLVMERRRPEAQRSPEWSERWKGSIISGVGALSKVKQRPDKIDLGDLAAVCALGYLDFRLPDIDWRSGTPGLEHWYTDASTLPSLCATSPKAA